MNKHTASSLEIPLHLVQPLMMNTEHISNGRDNQLAGDVTADFISRQRVLIHDGWPMETVFGPNVVEIDAVFGYVEHKMAPASVSQWLVYLAQPFDVLGVPERLGLMLLGSLFLRVSITVSPSWHCKVLTDYSGASHPVRKATRRFLRS